MFLSCCQVLTTQKYLSISNLKFIKNILTGKLAAYEAIVTITDYLRSIGLLLDSLAMYLVANEYNKKEAQAFANEYNQDKDYE